MGIIELETSSPPLNTVAVKSPLSDEPILLNRYQARLLAVLSRLRESHDRKERRLLHEAAAVYIHLLTCKEDHRTGITCRVEPLDYKL